MEKISQIAPRTYAFLEKLARPGFTASGLPIEVPDNLHASDAELKALETDPRRRRMSVEEVKASGQVRRGQTPVLAETRRSPIRPAQATSHSMPTQFTTPGDMPTIPGRAIGTDTIPAHQVHPIASQQPQTVQVRPQPAVTQPHHVQAPTHSSGPVHSPTMRPGVGKKLLIGGALTAGAVGAGLAYRHFHNQQKTASVLRRLATRHVS